MAGYIEVDKIRLTVLEGLDYLNELRKAAERFAALPSVEASEELLVAYDKYANHTEAVKTNLAVMVKQAQGDDDGMIVAGVEAENGILLK